MRVKEKYYQEAMDLQPLGIDGINAMIVCKKISKQKVSPALLDKALKAIEKHPKHFLTLFNISLVYLEQQNYTEANSYLERAYQV